MNTIARARGAKSSGPQLDNRRVLAGLIDLLVVAVGAGVLGFLAGAISGESSPSGSQMSAVLLGWALYYYFALESGAGQTLGKKAMGLRVVRADGRPAGMREIAVRTILRVVDGIGLYVVGLVAMLATGERRQRLGDLAAGTVVTSATTPAAAPQPEAGRATEEPSPSVPPAALAATAPAEPATASNEPATASNEPATASNEPAPVEPIVAHVPEPTLADPPVEPTVEEPAPAEPTVADQPVKADDERPTPAEPTLAPVEADDERPAEFVYEPITSDADEPAEPPAEPEMRPFDPFPSAPEPEADDAPPVPPPAAEAEDWSFPAAAEPEDDGPEQEPREGPEVTVRTVETVSAMDLLMSEVEEDETAGPAQA